MDEKDPREKKLPVWAVEIIRKLRQDFDSLRRNNIAVEAENDRLRGVIEGKYGGDTDADTFYVNDDTAQRLPLGKGPIIRFGDFYDVTFNSDVAGEEVLVVQCDRPLQVLPVTPDLVAIAPSGR